jgi:hypothetical protein
MSLDPQLRNRLESALSRLLGDRPDSGIRSKPNTTGPPRPGRTWLLIRVHRD